VYKVLRQTAPPYLADMCQPVSTSSSLEVRSVLTGILWRCDAEQQDTESEVFPRLYRELGTHYDNRSRVATFLFQ